MARLTGPITKGSLGDLVFLEWVVPVDGYRFEQREANPKMQALAGLYLTSIGTRSWVYRPLEDYPAMFREFADVELTPEGVVSFANKYGAPIGDLDWTYEGLPMTATPQVNIGEIYWGNHLESIYDYIQDMRHAVEQFERGDINHMNMSGSSIARAVLKFHKYQGRDTPNLFIQPDSLKDAMWFQFARFVSDGMQIRNCAQCPTWFAFGSGTGRRKSALYCSDKCRKAAYEKHRRIER